MIKTYGVFGKVEFVLMASVAGKMLTIDFCGGSTNSRGVIPASYRTGNPLVQGALERTDEFKAGIVKLLQAIPEECDLRAAKAREEARVRAAREAEAHAKAEAEARAAGKAEAEAGAQAGEADAGGSAAGAKDEAEADADGSAAEEAAAGSGSERVKVKVSGREDAVEHLKTNYGYASVRLRTREAIERAAAEHGIEFVGL